MNISAIINDIKQPALYEKGTAFMWDDAYISKQILDIHLNPEIDLGSRKKSGIEKNVNWIMQQFPDKKLNILDLEAEQFHLVTMIFTDLGVLNPNERKKVLQLVHKVLRQGGIFIFDVLNDNKIENKVTSKSWECRQKGFWSPNPYLALSQSFLYEKEKVILYQHHVIGENKSKIYRFWTHFFSHEEITKILEEGNFKPAGFYTDVLPQSDIWNGDHVSFCKAIKI